MTFEEAKEVGFLCWEPNAEIPKVCVECGSLEDTLIGINEDAGLDR
jgi:hypothetical protein